MEASTNLHLLQSKQVASRPFAAGASRRCVKLPKHCRVRAVLTTPADDIIGISMRSGAETLTADNKAGGTVYHDNWFDRLAANHLSQSIQALAGVKSKKSGYEGLTEAAAAVYKNFNPSQQRELVTSALDRAFPRPILNLIRMVLPQSQFAREYFAAFTTVFFSWLVGNCEVKESEVNERREKNVVHINNCRFLEETNCVGMCLNLCKMPCQTFIKDSLGMPVNMVPNFEDMSCQMVFGQDPLPAADDPAFKQPCFNLCKAKKKNIQRIASVK